MDSNHGRRNIVGTILACKSRQTVLRIMDIRDQSFGSSLSLSFSLPFYNTIPVHFIEENGLDVKPIYRFRSRGSKSKCEAEGDLGRTNDEMAAFPNLFRVSILSWPRHPTTSLTNFSNPPEKFAKNSTMATANVPPLPKPESSCVPQSPNLKSRKADKPPFSLSFTQGLLLGQLSIVILIGAFIKFFIFGDPPSADVTASLRATERRSRTLAHKRSLLSLRSSTTNHRSSQPPTLNKKRSSILRNPPPLTTNTILSKTYYNVDSHQPESLDWFNVLIAQTIAQFRSDAQHDDAILTSLMKALNGGSRPDWLDEIKVTELSLGEDFPIFSICRVIPVDVDGLVLGNV
jgi:hypothetical protein